MPEHVLHLIDGHSLTFKAYYAIRNLTDATGRPTGAIYGFLRMLLKFIDDYQPSMLAVIFDAGADTFRKELYPQYKANREAAPEDFGEQLAVIFELLDALGIVQHQLVGYEADDLLATLTAAMERRGGRSLVMTADKDLFQLVTDKTELLRPGQQQELKRYDPAAVEAHLGIRPDQVPDWLALVGDSSDNIPGVPGIGEKSATALLQQWGSLENLLTHAAELSKPKQRESLLANAERARLALQLATVKRDVPFPYDIDACCLRGQMWSEDAARLMVRLGFQSILRERGVAIPAAPARVPVASTGGGDLFDAVAGDADASPAPEPPPQVAVEYRALSDEAELAAWVAQALQAEWLALDTETTSTNAMECELVGISLCHEAGRAIYIPVGHDEQLAGSPQLPLDRVRAVLAPLFAGGGPRLVAHHAKFDWKVLLNAGFSLVAPAFDTMIASYLLDPDKRSGHGLKALAQELCGVAMTPISELIGSGARAIMFSQLPVGDAYEYASRDADVTLRLTTVLRQRLAAEPVLERLLHEVEMPLMQVLLEMERGGFRIDVAVLRGLGEELRSQLASLTKRIWQVAGRQFNIGSSRQVAELLYEELKLPPGKRGKMGYSTDEEELERLAPQHEVPRLILEYRASEKLQSTYIDALPRLVHPKTGRIHTSFNQTIAATGRLSSTDPNLQNIPIRTEMGRAIRRAFVADGPGHVVLKADYSQIELRILAHVSGDRNLCAAYREGRDIHAQTARELFGVGEGEVTRAMRDQAKVVNFGIVYGMSAHGLAQRLGIGRGEAARYIERYFATYPGVQAWIDRLLDEARQRGWVETLLGRRRLLPDLTARNGQLRANAERMAVNSPIQGTSADMIKLAMINLRRELPAAAPGTRMICQVHDELVFSVPREQVEETSAFICRVMCEALPLDVPVLVEARSGPNWAEC